MSVPSLRVSLVQAHLAWHDAAANHRHFDQLTEPLAGQTDLIVLPEMFSTGFTMAAAEVAEPVDGPTTQWMKAVAKRTGAVVTGSVVVNDAGAYLNRLIWMCPDGSYTTYDKRHLFRMAAEHKHYAPGAKQLLVELNGWHLCPLVCYDLRFPVWSRQSATHSYDVLLYVANWPERRRYAWQTLLKARAIENLSYCIGVNRVGSDGTNVTYTGDSVALDFMGQPIGTELEGECVRTVSLDHAALTAFRAKFPAHLDADEFEIR